MSDPEASGQSSGLQFSKLKSMIVKRWSERENLGSRAPGLVSSFWGKKKSTLTGQRGEDCPLQFQNHCWAKHKGGSKEDRPEGGAWFTAAGVGGNSQDRSSGH